MDGKYLNGDLILDPGVFITVLGSRENIWSFQVSKEVRGEIGKEVILPCTFTHPHNIHDGVIAAIWRVGQPYHGTVMFKCVSNSSNDPCKTTINYMNKFKLLGNPRNNNISVAINNLTWSDSNKYFCRVEFSSNRHHQYEVKSGTKLQLMALPRIINITVGFDYHRGYHAICIAEGEPVPSIIWIDPLKDNKDLILSQPILKHQTMTELHYLVQDGKYTCAAMNSYGKAESSVYFFKFKSGGSENLIYYALWIALGVKLLIVFGILSLSAVYNKGK
ncbi:sialic acid-binding Ig-like lectin 15 [Bombina bombina]|uniref:sialic acid-binding Ig-like lectin 15 n=1 Tax=Bombina bombina TaxID=8345 RepID=UPI00235AC30A|nr:sialic acid-binding Ig-like lectin 15 [Bombina bombina]